MDGHVALSDRDRVQLLELALAVVRSGIERRPIPGMRVPESPALAALGATFVTLERDGELLGCIGTIEPVRPLYEDVMQNAYRSAFADPRLPAVTAGDFPEMAVKVSVLGPLEPLAAADRVSLLAALRPGTDGLLVEDGSRRATFLPAVWDRVESPEEFLELLLRKGSLPTRRWPSGMRAWRYTTEEFADPGPRPALS